MSAGEQELHFLHLAFSLASIFVFFHEQAGKNGMSASLTVSSLDCSLTPFVSIIAAPAGGARMCVSLVAWRGRGAGRRQQAVQARESPQMSCNGDQMSHPLAKQLFGIASGAELRRTSGDPHRRIAFHGLTKRRWTVVAPRPDDLGRLPSPQSRPPSRAIELQIGWQAALRFLQIAPA